MWFGLHWSLSHPRTMGWAANEEGKLASYMWRTRWRKGCPEKHRNQHVRCPSYARDHRRKPPSAGHQSGNKLCLCDCHFGLIFSYRLTFTLLWPERMSWTSVRNTISLLRYAFQFRGVCPVSIQILCRPGPHSFVACVSSTLLSWSWLRSTKRLPRKYYSAIHLRRSAFVCKVPRRHQLTISQGYIPLPKSASKERIISNTQLFDFDFVSGDVDHLDSLNESKPTFS